MTVTCVPPSGSTFPLGDTAVSCTGVDDSGNPTAGDFTVSVLDTTAPTVTVPAAIVMEATGPTGAQTPFTVTASDLVDGDVPVLCSAAAGDLFQIGSTAVECSATDAAGNTGTAVFGVTVVDTTAPALHLPADITMEATGPETLVAFAVTADDAVTLDPTVTCTPMSGSGFIVGDHTVHCEATDTVGNTSTGDFSVTIQDTTAPELTLPSDDVVAEATGAEGAAVTFEATASDLVDDDPSVSCDVPSGSVLRPR